MNFLTLSTGGMPDGSAEHAHMQAFTIIPDGTMAAAMIKSIENKEFPDSAPFIQVTWKLVNSDFKGNEVRQKLDIFNPDIKKSDRAKQMFMRLCILTGCEIQRATDDDLLQFKNKIIGIKIQEWQLNGKEGNWVSELHPAGGDFVAITGTKKEVVHTQGVESALTRNAAVHPGLTDDIPF